MSDLEDLWNRYPAGEPPLDVIRGRAGARRRAGIVAAAALAVAAAFVAGMVVASDDGGSTPAPPQAHDGAESLPAVAPVAFHADLSAAGSCAALRATYVDRALGRVGAYGWESAFANLYGAFASRRAALPSNARMASLPVSGAHATLDSGLRTDRVTASDTGTNVQEMAVDEPDSVKTDGRLLVRLRDDQLVVDDVSGKRVDQVATLVLDGVEDGELLLSGDTVLVVGADARSARSDLTGERRGTRVLAVSLAVPSQPVVTSQVTYAAALSSVRLTGDTVRLVLASGLPDLAFVHPRKGITRREALARNRRAVRRSTLADWLPSYSAGEGRRRLLDCSDVAVPPARAGLDTASVVTFRAGDPTEPRAFGLAAATTIAYQSTDHLYLVAAPATDSFLDCIDCRLTRPQGGTSYLFQFDLTPDQAVHVASGEVEGVVADRWAMDESDGELRVLVGPSSETGDFSSVVTFRREGERLVETGRLDGLGRGQEVKSVRWEDDLALVVTYRRIDPLYVVDLRGRPRLHSKLEVPGYSDYLHPLGPGRLVGIGYGPGPGGWSAQLGLFGVQDLSRVRRLDVHHWGRGSDAVASYDPRAFTWLPDHRAVITVVTRGPVGLLSVSRLWDGRLHTTTRRVEYGTDAADVRTIGLADGRVVLVTGEQVRFLDVPPIPDAADR